MNVELFVLCDAATDYNGKLNILGAFDSIWSRNVPVVHPLCAVAVRMRFSRNETGQHKIKVNIIDGDGNPVAKPFEASVAIQFGNDMNSVATNMILNMQGLKFQNYGEYAVDLAVDGRHEASLPLHLYQFQQKPQN